MSPKGYLIRAIYSWCLDEGFTPYIVVDLSIDGVKVPEEFTSDDQIVFDIAEDACEFLELDNEWISFNAEFDGVIKQVVFPVQAVSGIYAQENTKGLFFDPKDDDEPSHPFGQEHNQSKTNDDDDGGFEVLK